MFLMLANSKWPLQSPFLPNNLLGQIHPFQDFICFELVERPRQDVQILMGMITATRQAQLGESQRRLVWEQEQEARYAQRQADMEHRMLEMLEEIKTLRSTINALNNSAPVVSLSNASSPTAHLPTTPASIQPASPIWPALQPPFSHSQLQRMLIRDSPNNSDPTEPPSNHVPSTCDPLTPGTSPQVESSEQATPASSKPRKRKKKRKPSPSSDDDDGSTSSSSSSAICRPQKRKNNHDTQCYTIHVRY
jgi:hypothetical protein